MMRVRSDVINSLLPRVECEIARWSALKRESTKHATVGNNAWMKSERTCIDDMYESQDTLWDQPHRDITDRGVKPYAALWVATSVCKLSESERERRWEVSSVFVYAYRVRQRQPNPPYHSRPSWQVSGWLVSSICNISMLRLPIFTPFTQRLSTAKLTIARVLIHVLHKRVWQ